MPYVNVADGIPDLVAPTVVVGGAAARTAGGRRDRASAAGLLVELTSPVGTLGRARPALPDRGRVVRPLLRARGVGARSPPRWCWSVAGGRLRAARLRAVQLMLGTRCPPRSWWAPCCCPDGADRPARPAGAAGRPAPAGRAPRRRALRVARCERPGPGAATPCARAASRPGGGRPGPHAARGLAHRHPRARIVLEPARPAAGAPVVPPGHRRGASTRPRPRRQPPAHRRLRGPARRHPGSRRRRSW